MHIDRFIGVLDLGQLMEFPSLKFLTETPIGLLVLLLLGLSPICLEFVNLWANFDRYRYRCMDLGRDHTRSRSIVLRCLVYELKCRLWWKKGQPGARSSRLRRVRRRVWPFCILCTQSFPAFLQEAVSRTWTHDLVVTRQQLYRCAKAPLRRLGWNLWTNYNGW
jgi:hypothetical protein